MRERERKLTELVGRLKEAAHANLEAVILYGSAAREDFDEGHSDLNVLCVMRSLAVEELKRVAPVVSWWEKEQKEPPPLLFTEKELRESADVFSIELLDIQRNHRVLFGKNPVEGIVVPTNLHRVQLEHDLRTVLLRLRQHFVLFAGNERELRGVMAKSISSVKTLLRHTLIAFGEEPPHAWDAVFAQVGKLTGADANAFAKALELRRNGAANGAAHGNAHGEITAEFGAYLRALEQVTEKLDHLVPKREWQRVAKQNS
jgi:predicted nucleotidyltransferase